MAKRKNTGATAGNDSAATEEKKVIYKAVTVNPDEVKNYNPTVKVSIPVK